MPKSNLRVYAIVELLMLLAQIDKSIGDYRGHAIRHNYVSVKTSTGSITFSQAFIMKQFAEPENVTKKELLNAISVFRPKQIRQHSA